MKEEIRKLRSDLRHCILEDRWKLTPQFDRLLAAARKEAGRDEKRPAEELRRLKKEVARCLGRAGRRKRNLPQLNYPAHLPIIAKRDLIVRAMRNNQVVVIAGETGSGKSTQIPKMCLEAGQGICGKIGITQPRRVAATSIAAQLARELEDEQARFVGYKIRFQDKTPPEAYIKVMTDGILLAELQNDRYLMQYDTIIVDEAHERNLNIDFILGMIKELLKKRRDLKLVITSATIDPEKFSKAFDDAPVIEVSGRMYPVEVRYRPLDESLEEEGDLTVNDLAVQAVEELRTEGSGFGDILVFMPTERDIQETVELLQSRDLHNTVILPLYGRLTGADQNRVFQRFDRQKIVVATNVAETSLTIPGIKYVIDSGLARISRYSPRSGIQSLPIERITQSSANQRKGRCGRVAAGIAVRLYAEEDFNARPLFTEPEILRSNLADVILTMQSMRLGDVQKFPFIDPPSANAVKDGYRILKELGALDNEGCLTPLGRTMSRLPMDPRIARMILEAKKERALREVLIIASALCVRDPRERPAEKQALADQAHAAFNDPRSDFLSYLKLWDAYQDASVTFKSQNKMHRFCKAHFLSYARMREWIDIHQEISAILNELGGYPVNTDPADYGAVHRAILSGYLSNLAVKKENGEYLAAKGRSVTIFPGSGLFRKGGDWIVAAELVETTKLFARTAASIDVAWLEQLGGHLCRSSYSEPHWEKRRGEVVAYEKKTLFGLPIVEKRKVGYGRVNPGEANELFIRSALIEGDVNRIYPFLQHNQALVARIEGMENRVRRRDLLADEEVQFRFYAERIKEISDIRSFEKFLKERGNDGFLKMNEEDLLVEKPDPDRLEQHPDHMLIGDHRLELQYLFSPGRDEDGVTVVVPQQVVRGIPPASVEWVVPGLLEEKICFLLKSLPKSIRKNLVPAARYAAQIARELPRSNDSFYSCLGRHIQARYGITIPRDAWQENRLPLHLKMRFSVMDDGGKEIASGRDLDELSKKLPQEQNDRLWGEARKKRERSGITSWNFGDLPAKVPLRKENADVCLYAYCGLKAEGDSVAIRLFCSEAEAERAHRDGLTALCSLHFADELKHLKNALFLPKDMEALCVPFGACKQFNRSMFEFVRQNLFSPVEGTTRDEAAFLLKTRELEGKILLLGQEANLLIQQVLRARRETFDTIIRFAGLAGKDSAARSLYLRLEKELDRLLPGDFLNTYDLTDLGHLPRYLKALRVRAERAYANREKDQLKEKELEPHLIRLERAVSGLSDKAPRERHILVAEYRWMIEEYKVSLFAQELRTAYPVSAARLDRQWKRVEEVLR